MSGSVISFVMWWPMNSLILRSPTPTMMSLVLYGLLISKH